MRAHSLYFSKAAWITFPVLLLLCAYWSVVLLRRNGKKSVAGKSAQPVSG
jgi:hypothetical protein